MPRLPDRFDLWVRKARACPDPERQLDYVLGALTGLASWHFLNIGTKEKPEPATGEIENEPYLLVFSDADRAMEIVGQTGRAADASSVITTPTEAAMIWCVEKKQCGLLVNPGEDAAAIPLGHVAAFLKEWRARVARHAAGFWIPNLTSEEEDFWQEHGL